MHYTIIKVANSLPCLTALFLSFLSAPANSIVQLTDRPATISPGKTKAYASNEQSIDRWFFQWNGEDRDSFWARYFDGAIEISRGSTGWDTWALKLKLESWGRSNCQKPAPPQRASLTNGRLEIERGPLTEWYISTKKGIEQGFTITQPPDCEEGRTDPLVLEISIEGASDCVFSADDREMQVLTQSEDAIINYTGLIAWDSNGQNLNASLSATATGIRILVDDYGASYPVVIDPLIWVEEARLVASDASNSRWLGPAIAASEGIAIVGAPFADSPLSNSGSAYVYTRNGNQWMEVQKLVPSDPHPGGLFGSSVAMSGCTLVVGAAGAEAVYVFELEGGTWGQRARLTAMDPLADGFANAVAIDGNTIAVGACSSFHAQPGNSQCFSGAVYIYERGPEGWSQMQTVLAGDAACRNQFGVSVDIDEGTLLVGGLNGLAVEKSGSAYSFSDSSGQWTQEQQLTPLDPSTFSGFGEAVSLIGDTALIGSKRDDSACPGLATCDSGAAYLFGRSFGIWTQLQKLTSSDRSAGANFGAALNVSGSGAVVSAPLDSTIGSLYGAAYAFVLDGGSLTEEAKLVPSVIGPNHRVGFGVAQTSERVFVSSDAGIAGPTAGSVFVFRRQSASVSTRNAGSNPLSFNCNPAVIGKNWTATVDLSTTGHTHAQIIGTSSPALIPLVGGQVLLIGGPQVFRLPLKQGPIASWSALTPNDCALAGVSISAQAAHFFGIAPYALSNAQDLLVGF